MSTGQRSCYNVSSHWTVKEGRRVIGRRKTAATQRHLVASLFLGGQEKFNAFHDAAITTLEDEFQSALVVMRKELDE